MNRQQAACDAIKVAEQTGYGRVLPPCKNSHGLNILNEYVTTTEGRSLFADYAPPVTAVRGRRPCFCSCRRRIPVAPRRPDTCRPRGDGTAGARRLRLPARRAVANAEHDRRAGGDGGPLTPGPRSGGEGRRRQRGWRVSNQQTPLAASRRATSRLQGSPCRAVAVATRAGAAQRRRRRLPSRRTRRRSSHQPAVWQEYRRPEECFL